MYLRRALLAAGVVVGAAAVSVVFAKDRRKPVAVDPTHPNLGATQDLIDLAFGKIVDAQQANEWDWDGHAARAKQLLQKANSELRQASETASRIRRQITLLSPEAETPKTTWAEHINGPGAVLRLG
jgi:hypothetical protein